MKIKYVVSLFVLLFMSVGAYAQNANTAPLAQGDRPLRVIRKPPAAPGYCRQSEALTRLRVTFDKSATVTAAVVVIPSGCDEFDGRAAAAALKIRFEPAIKDGEPVTVTKLVEYKYRRY